MEKTRGRLCKGEITAVHPAAFRAGHREVDAVNPGDGGEDALIPGPAVALRRQGGKDGYGGAYFAGQRMVGCAVLVQIPGNLIEAAADPAVLGCELPDSGEQFVIDRRHMDNGAYGGAPYRLPEKFGLADTIGRKPRCEVGVFIFGQPGERFPARWCRP